MPCSFRWIARIFYTHNPIDQSWPMSRDRYQWPLIKGGVMVGEGLAIWEAGVEKVELSEGWSKGSGEGGAKGAPVLLDSGQCFTYINLSSYNSMCFAVDHIEKRCWDYGSNSPCLIIGKFSFLQKQNDNFYIYKYRNPHWWISWLILKFISKMFGFCFQYETLCNSSKQYEPGTQYDEFVRRLTVSAAHNNNNQEPFAFEPYAPDGK